MSDQESEALGTDEQPIYGHMLVVRVGGTVDGPAFDRLMDAAIESSAWFAVSDQRISDLRIDLDENELRECASEEINEQGLLELVLAAPTGDDARSVTTVCRTLGLPYERRLEALDLRLRDESEYWIPGMASPEPVVADGQRIDIPPFETRF